MTKYSRRQFLSWGLVGTGAVLLGTFSLENLSNAHHKPGHDKGPKQPTPTPTPTVVAEEPYSLFITHAYFMIPAER